MFVRACVISLCVCVCVCVFYRLSNIYPDALIYAATRRILPGEEIIVAYHNNESKKVNTSPQKSKKIVTAEYAAPLAEADVSVKAMQFVCNEMSCQ
jgi:hypothetical protein